MIVNRARLALETVAADWLTSPHNVDAATASTHRRVERVRGGEEAHEGYRCQRRRRSTSGRAVAGSA